MSEHDLRPSGEAEAGDVPLESLLHLVGATSPDEVYQWGVSTLSERIGADTCKIATRADGLLVPTISTNGGNTGREHAIPIATTIPGSVFVSGEGCAIPDLQDIRGGITKPVPGGNDAESMRAHVAHRSMLCAPIDNLGVIVGLAVEPDAFDEHDLAVATSIGRIVGGMATLLSNRPNGSEQGVERLLEEITNIVSHDLRNKLNIASGRLELAEETGDAEHFAACAEAIDGIEAISDMVVTLSGTGKPLDEVVEVDIRTVAESTFEPLNEPGAQLAIKATATILADPYCLSQMLENLFRNAIEHANGPVRIEVGLLEDGLYVSDDGPGIPADIRDAVFDLGFSTSENHEGKGLSIVLRLAEAHGWTIELTDSFLGGTRVEIHRVVFR